MIKCERNSEGDEAGVGQVDEGGCQGLSESRWVVERSVPSKTRLMLRCPAGVSSCDNLIYFFSSFIH